MILEGTFDFVIDDAAREVHVLYGHQYNFPIASRKAGTLELKSDKNALRFTAKLPPVEARPSWVKDAVAAAAGLIGGIPPGFKIPPREVVPDAEELIDEEGSDGVKIRVIRAATLFELSLVSWLAYGGTELDMRAENVSDLRNRRLFLCL